MSPRRSQPRRYAAAMMRERAAASSGAHSRSCSLTSCSIESCSGSRRLGPWARSLRGYMAFLHAEEGARTIPSAPTAGRAGEPEAGGSDEAEADCDEECQAVAAGDVVHEAAEPGRHTAPDTVAHAEEAVDGAETTAGEQLRGDRGDDRPARAEAQAEQQRVSVERGGVRRDLERQQAQRTRCRAAVGDRRRSRATDPVRREAEADPPGHREQAGEPEDPSHEQAREDRKSVV